MLALQSLAGAMSVAVQSSKILLIWVPEALVLLELGYKLIKKAENMSYTDWSKILHMAYSADTDQAFRKIRILLLWILILS